MQGEIKLQVASCELKCKIQEVGCKCKEQDEDKVSGYEIRRQVTSCKFQVASKEIKYNMETNG